METFEYRTYPVPIRKTVLENGLTVITIEMPPSLTVNVHVAIRAGTYHDQVPGTAHFLEHVLSSGSRAGGVPPRIRSLYLTDPRTEANAHTNTSYTCYELEGSQCNAPELIRALAEALIDIQVGPDVLRRHREIILRELEASASEDVVSRWAYRQLYPHVPRLTRSSYGSARGIKRMSAATLSAYYRHNYVSHAMAVVYCGSVAHTDVIKWVRSSALMSFPERPDLPRVRRWRFVPARAHFGGWNDDSMVISLPTSRRPAENGLLAFARFLLNQNELGTLYQRLRQGLGAVYTLEDNRCPLPERRVEIDAVTTPDHFDLVEHAIFEEIARIKRGDIPNKIFEMVRASYQNELDHPEEYARDNLMEKMVELWVTGSTQDRCHQRVCVEATKEQVGEVVARYWKTSSTSVLTFTKQL